MAARTIADRVEPEGQVVGVAHRRPGDHTEVGWHLEHRIREALADGRLPGFEGPVEADETFIGGKAKNMHAAKRRERIRGRGTLDKTPLMGGQGPRDRQSRGPADGRHHLGTLIGVVAETTQPGSTVFTDGDRGYDPLKEMGYLHATVMHSVGEYVRGPVSTNGIENYWSHLKRT